jgi:hypothetical protein
VGASRAGVPQRLRLGTPVRRDALGARRDPRGGDAGAVSPARGNGTRVRRAGSGGERRLVPRAVPARRGRAAGGLPIRLAPAGAQRRPGAP